MSGTHTCFKQTSNAHLLTYMCEFGKQCSLYHRILHYTNFNPRNHLHLLGPKLQRCAIRDRAQNCLVAAAALRSSSWLWLQLDQLWLSKYRLASQTSQSSAGPSWVCVSRLPGLARHFRFTCNPLLFALLEFTNGRHQPFSRSVLALQINTDIQLAPTVMLSRQ